MGIFVDWELYKQLESVIKDFLVGDVRSAPWHSKTQNTVTRMHRRAAEDNNELNLIRIRWKISSSLNLK